MANKTDMESAKSLAAIAAECNVSAMTVSRALRNSGPVRESTREKILLAAEKLGYHRLANKGRPAALDRNRPAYEVVIGCNGKNIGMFYSELLASIESELTGLGCDCIIRHSSGEYGQFMGLISLLKKTTSIGAMLVGYFEKEQLESLIEAVPNVILVDNSGSPDIRRPHESICFDNEEAARLAVRHLAERGKKEILLLKGFKDHYFSKEMESGYREVHKELGLKVDARLIHECDFTAEGACKAMEECIRKGVGFDSVLTNDEMACGVYRALYEAGLKIPDDVAVCGCDGLPSGRQMIPSLTTVALDYRELGRRAVEIVTNPNRKTGNYCRTRLLPTLEPRESTVARK